MNNATAARLEYIKNEMACAGVAPRDIVTALSAIDTLLRSEISEEIEHSLEPEELDELNEANEGTSDEAFFALVGITKSDIEALHAQKLERYVAQLPEHIATLKAQILSKSN
jgi:hypothetical protein